MSESEIAEVIAGIDAGHHMAGLEPDEFARELARLQLRGDLAADDAVRLAIAHARRG